MTRERMTAKIPETITPQQRTKILNDDMRSSIPSICLERARLVTESYRQTEGEPYIIRRAMALAHILGNMTIFIRDEELIVGNHASSQRFAPLFPDTGLFSKKELDLLPVRNVDRLRITETQKQELLNEIYPYWQDRCLETLAKRRFSDDSLKLASYPHNIFNAFSRTRSGYGHYLPNIEAILHKGFATVEANAKDKLATLSNEEDEKRNFYHSAIIICAAVKAFAERYSTLAYNMATNEKNERRKKELLQISKNCQRVPYYSASSFHEALQGYWFCLLIDYIFQNGSAISAGRFDQFIYPFYKHDKEKGLLTDSKAQELIQVLWIKHNDIIKACTYDSARNNGGFSTSTHLTVGGIDKDGVDACNELTFMCLKADKNVFNCEPNIGVRFSQKNPIELGELVFDILNEVKGGKYPLFNDETIINSLVNDNLPLEEARNYGIVGCVEPSPYGNSLSISNACYFSLAKCLELALNDGQCVLTGNQLGPRTGDASKFQTFEEVKAAYETQVSYFVQKMCETLNSIEETIALYTPHIYCSLLLDDCMEKGIDSAAGGSRYNYCGVQGVGVPDVADSLAAIKQVVFNKKTISMGELCNMLRTNFENHEAERQILISKAPKYGNDLDDVDMLARWSAEYYCNEVGLYKEWRGGHFRPGLYCVSANTPLGRSVGALPSGRLSGTPLADGGISPKHGMDLNGPTAVFLSAAKLNYELITNGVDLNMKLLPSLAKTKSERLKLAQLVRSYFKSGGMHVQFNVLSDNILRSAQLHPEEYCNLVIRVAGYSAFFIDLDKDIQDEIINRTTMGL